ncbi:MAG: helix-turn-helix domain-containing protein [Nocardioides sp.]
MPALVGTRLRVIRQALELSGEVVASDLGWSQPKLSRIESGRIGVRVADLARLLQLYGVPDDVKAELISQVSAVSGSDGTWVVRAGGVSRRQGEVAYVEQKARGLRQFSVWVPGQMQSRGYAAAMLRQFHGDPSAAVSARMRRQAILEAEQAPRYELVLYEAALRRWPGGTAVRKGQLRHLVDRMTLPAVDARVLQDGPGQPVALSPFVIYDFAASSSPPIVLVETQTADVYLSSESDVRAYGDLFSSLQERALTPGESRDFALSLLDQSKGARS